MKYPWLLDYCLLKKGAVHEYKAEWGAALCLVGGKMFVMMGEDKQGKSIVTLKCEPPFGKMLRENYKDIIPGYYMNKEHWNSVYTDGEVPDDVLKQMVDQSYRLVFEGLAKKVQQQIGLLP